MFFLIFIVIIVFLLFLYNKNKPEKNRTWTKDYVVSTTAAIFEELVKISTENIDNTVSLILSGKLIVLGDYEDICWVGMDSKMAFEANVLLDFAEMSDGNKFVIRTLLYEAQDEAEAGNHYDTSRLIKFILCAKVVHRHLMKSSVYYKNLSYKDSSFA